MKFVLPLRYSIPLLLAIVGFLLVLVAFFDGLQRSEEQIDDEARAQILTFGTRDSANIERAYAIGNSQGVGYMLLRSASEPHLRTATVVDAQGNTMESTDVAQIGMSLADIAPHWALTALQRSIATGHAELMIDASGSSINAIFPFAMPPTRGALRSNRVAALYLNSDLSEQKRVNWTRHVQRAWFMGAMVIVSLLVVWLYFHWTVTKRLERLAAAMHRVTVGDLTDHPVGVDGRDELGRLSKSFTQMLHEISQRRQALATSEERYRSIIHAMSEGIVIQRDDATIIATNESASRVLGLTEDQLHGRTSMDPRWRAVHEDGSPFPGDTHPSVVTLRTGKSQSGVVMGVHRPDGTLRWISINSEPVILDATTNERGVVCTFLDITSRREAQLQGQRERERVAAIVGSAMDSVICTDGEMRITLFNRAAEDMFGRQAADMLGQPLDCLLPERFRGSHKELMQQFSKTSVTKRSMGKAGEIVGLRANGEEFPIEASIARVSLGEELVLTVILRDISERKQAELQREQLEAQLRQSQKMQSLGTLTGGIAHDFNNILTAISGNTHLAQIELQEANIPVPHPVRRSLMEIEKAAARATDLVRQVLAFGRRQEAQRTPVNLADVVTEALKFLRAMTPAMIEIRRQFPDNLPLVAVDSTQIHQVITNLGTNAAHAIGDRAGRIDVTIADVVLTSEQALATSDLHEGRYLRLTFCDTGGGIDPLVVERIFEPFFTTKSVGQGTGLGLSVVHGIMKNHDGAIVVRSDPGSNTRFDLYFPVAAQSNTDTRMAATLPGKTQARGMGKTIIYIDDEEALVFLVTRILERSGYKVLGFTDPVAALTALTNDSTVIDALVSDLSMPVMTGFDVVRKAHALRPQLPIVLVSGFVRTQDTELAQQLGVRRLVLKPDTVDALAAALHDVLEEQR